jgi:signal transduction histidine kinase
MVFNIDLINILILVATITNTLYGLVIYSQNRRSATNVSFFILTLGVACWGISMLLFRNIAGDFDVSLASRLLYASAAIIPFASLYFAKIFPELTPQFTRAEKYFAPIPFIVAVVISLVPGLLIDHAYVIAGTENFIVFNQGLHGLYIFYIVGYFSWVFLILIKKYLRSTGLPRQQVLYMLIGTFTTASIGVFTNLLLPFFGVFTLNWLGQIGVLAMITSITYAILKHHLFDAKIIATEIFVFFLWVFIFARILLSETPQDLFFNLALFIVTVVVGLFLVKSVIKEVEAREEVERLATDLAKANDRLKELDQMKSEFLSLATHQIRGPLTAIKGYASLLIEGSYGKLPHAVTEAVEKIFHSSDSLALLVEDFLNISRIEQGRMKYDFVDTDMEALVREVAGELAPNVSRAKLQFGVSTDGRGPYRAKVDIGKIRQVIANLLDNAIKYTPSGSISIGLEKTSEGKIRIEVSDTGVGIDQVTLPTLFNKFTRAKDASKTNVSGTGLGLYVAKEMVKAHGGRIWAESAGKGHGSIFFVELKAV